MPVTGQVTVSIADYDGELSAARVNCTVLSAANFEAQATLRTTFRNALYAMTNGELQKTQYGNVSQDSISNADTAEAQREKKWLVSYHDSTSLKRYSFEIGCADLTLLDAEDRAHAEIGDAGIVDAFVAAAEAFMLSPTGGAIVIDEITLVGRNI